MMDIMWCVIWGFVAYMLGCAIVCWAVCATDRITQKY